MKDLVVISGGTSGLGFELVKLFSKKYEVVSISRTPKQEAVLSGVMYEYGDICDEKFVKLLYSKYSKNYKIKFLINNAAVGLFGSPETNTKDRIDIVLGAGLTGLILNTTYAIPLLDQNGSKIINILSTASLKGNVNESLYCAQKWGAKGYTESLKATYKGTKIKVVSVCPGGMNSNFWNQNRDYVSTEKSNNWMNPAEVAKVIFDNVTNDKLCVSDIVIERV